MFELTISAIASLLLLALSVYVILKERTAANVALSFAILLLALIEVLDQCVLNLSSDPFVFKKVAIFLESILPVTLLFFSLTYSREKFVKSKPFWWALMAVAILFPASVVFLPIDAFFYSPDLQTEKMLFLEEAGYWFYILMMLYYVAALINLEATMFLTSGIERWRIKFELIGIGSILAVLILYYSQVLLFRAINMDLIPMRSGIFIIATLLSGYSRIFRGNGVRIVVSRYILYRSLTILLLGIYFLIIGIIGEGMRYLEISFSKDLTMFLAFVSGITMFLIFLSERLRRRIRVFISKHFFEHKHAYRDKWLEFTDKLAFCKKLTDVYEAILKIYIKTFELDVASLYLLDESKERYMPVAHQPYTVNEAELKASAGLISYFIERGRVFDPLGNEYMPGAEEASFLRQVNSGLIVPLIFKEKIEGFVVFGRNLTNEKFIYEDFDLMKTLAQQATQAIVNFRLSEELIETREVAAMARISSFIIHDIKNLMYKISLTFDNAKEYIDNPEFQDDMLETMRNTLTRMKNLIQRLKSFPEKHSLNTELADMNLLGREMIEEVMKMRPGVEIFFNGSTALSMVDVAEIKKVILNLILNALDAIGEKGTVKAETGTDGDSIFLKVIDDGCGTTEDFIKKHLFKPFRTTKRKGLGIGLYQCKQIVEAHGGLIGVESEAGRGSVFTVYLPAARELCRI